MFLDAELNFKLFPSRQSPLLITPTAETVSTEEGGVYLSPALVQRFSMLSGERFIVVRNNRNLLARISNAFPTTRLAGDNW